MMPRKGKKFRTSARTEALAIMQRHAARIDVHAAVQFVAVPAAGVRKFGANTEDLEAMAAWLTASGVTTIATESMGVYWIPLYELCAGRGFDVILVDPRQTKHAPGRPKSDVLDCRSSTTRRPCHRPSSPRITWPSAPRSAGAFERRSAATVVGGATPNLTCLRVFPDDEATACDATIIPSLLPSPTFR